MTPQVVETLQRLVRAREYASDLGQAAWNHAIEWRLFRALGLEPADVRWLVFRGFVEMQREISIHGGFDRHFVKHDVIRLTHDTAFILTDAGLHFCRASFSPHNATHSCVIPVCQTSGGKSVSTKPSWCKIKRQLILGVQIVKVFRIPAVNQELVLGVFEETGWPEFIEDPLPQSKNVDAQQRLQSTIKSLNRHQVEPLIRFHANGGNKVFWKLN